MANFIKIRGQKVKISNEDGFITARDIDGNIIQATDGTLFRQRAVDGLDEKTIRDAIQRDKIQNQPKNLIDRFISGRTTKVHETNRWSEYESDRHGDKDLAGFFRGRFRVIIIQGKRVISGEVFVNSAVTIQQDSYAIELNKFQNSGKDGRKSNINFISKFFDGAVSQFLKQKKLENRFGSGDVGIVSLQDYALRYRILKKGVAIRSNNVSIVLKNEVR